MKELVKLVFALTLVSLLSGILLAVTHKVTSEPIRKSEAAALFDSLHKVLPPSEGDPVVLTVTNAAGRAVTFYAVRSQGAYAGVAFSCASEKGYGGPVEILLGLKADGAIQGLEVIKQNETPGLGTKMTAPSFRAQFIGKPLDAVWKVRKDGGTVDAISGATISSRALCDAVSQGLALYKEFKDAIAAAAAAAPAP